MDKEEDDLFGLNLFEDLCDFDPFPDIDVDYEGIADIDSLFRTLEEVDICLGDEDNFLNNPVSNDNDSNKNVNIVNVNNQVNRTTNINNVNSNNTHNIVNGNRIYINAANNTISSRKIGNIIKANGRKETIIINNDSNSNIQIRKGNLNGGSKKLNYSQNSLIIKRKKGVSLLAKPPNKFKLKGKSISPTRFEYFYIDHNYSYSNYNKKNIDEININNDNDLNKNDFYQQNEKTPEETELDAALNFLSDYQSLSLETEVIMNLEVEDLINTFDSKSEEIIYTTNSEVDEVTVAVSLVEEIAKIVETSDESSCSAVNSVDGRSNEERNADDLDDGESSSIKKNKYTRRRRKISARSSMSSSRSSSLSSSELSSSESCNYNISDNDSKNNFRNSNRNKMSRERKSESSSGDDNDNETINVNKDYLSNDKRKFRRKHSYHNHSSDVTNSNSNNYRSLRSIEKDVCSKKDAYLSRRKEVEERRIVYVGNIPEGTTKTDLRFWFGKFGPINQVSVHFRDYGNNYAFVTFQRRSDAYEAVHRGNDDPRHPKFELSFGGRRNFCRSSYQDLDKVEIEREKLNCDVMDFDSLLRTTKQKFRQ